MSLSATTFALGLGIIVPISKDYATHQELSKYSWHIVFKITENVSFEISRQNILIDWITLFQNLTIWPSFGWILASFSIQYLHIWFVSITKLYSSFHPHLTDILMEDIMIWRTRRSMKPNWPKLIMNCKSVRWWKKNPNPKWWSKWTKVQLQFRLQVMFDYRLTSNREKIVNFACIQAIPVNPSILPIPSWLNTPNASEQDLSKLLPAFSPIDETIPFMDNEDKPLDPDLEVEITRSRGRWAELWASNFTHIFIWTQ